jgi:hypothetical protein
VIEASNALAAAEDELREAVWSAYESGDSWLTIGPSWASAARRAHQRFGHRPTGADRTGNQPKGG